MPCGPATFASSLGESSVILSGEYVEWTETRRVFSNTFAAIPKALNYLLDRRRISTSSTQRVWSSKFSLRRCFNANIKNTERQDSWSGLPESSLGILASILIAMWISCEIFCGPVAQKRLTEPLSRTFARNLKSSATVALSAPAVKGWWR